MEKIRWLHLSDLHFGDTSQYSKESRTELLEYVKNKQWNPDYLFITGDIIYAKIVNDEQKRKAAYKEAAEYIKKFACEIWKEFKIENIERQIFIVPGNHDVVRDESRNDIIDGIKRNYDKDNLGKISKNRLDRSIDGMDEYFNFLKMIGKTDIGRKIETIHYVEQTNKANILHINTCVASGKDKEEGTLIFGMDLLLYAVGNIDNSRPTIVLAHHNIDCFVPSEQREIEVLLKKKGIFLYLCGHSHERESNIILRYNQSEMMNVFIAGTLMAERDTKNTVFLRGELDSNGSAGRVFSYKWQSDHRWKEDTDFGNVQSVGQGNFRNFHSGSLLNDTTSCMPLSSEGVISKIVSHTSFARKNTFNDVNKRAEKSLSVYGIGITHVSKDKELMYKILTVGGTVRLCMMDPDVFKKNPCMSLIQNESNLSQMTIKIDNCEIDTLKFCIAASHMDTYIREEYSKDVKESYERLLKFRDEIKGKGWKFHLRKLKSFVPISINMINENLDGKSELIVEYNMPFVSKRLLIHLKKNQNESYYTELCDVYDKIWEQAVEVGDES